MAACAACVRQMAISDFRASLAAAHAIHADMLVVTLATDGCRDTDLPAETAWPIIRHLTTATRRSALQGDPSGLEQNDGVCFDGLVTTDRSAP